MLVVDTTAALLYMSADCNFLRYVACLCVVLPRVSHSPTWARRYKALCVCNAVEVAPCSLSLSRGNQYTTPCFACNKADAVAPLLCVKRSPAPLRGLSKAALGGGLGISLELSTSSLEESSLTKSFNVVDGNKGYQLGHDVRILQDGLERLEIRCYSEGQRPVRVRNTAAPQKLKEQLALMQKLGQGGAGVVRMALHVPSLTVRGLVGELSLTVSRRYTVTSRAWSPLLSQSLSQLLSCVYRFPMSSAVCACV